MMNRKNSLWLSASFLMGTAAVTAQQVKKPHIILIMTDQQRGDCLGIQQSFIKTPNLDALAREVSVSIKVIRPLLVVRRPGQLY